jgi:hypothetical protein
MYFLCGQGGRKKEKEKKEIGEGQATFKHHVSVKDNICQVETQHSLQ